MTPYDLFGEIPVTWPEVHAWCDRIAAQLSPERRDWYILNWNVIEKIRQEKRATLPAIRRRSSSPTARARCAGFPDRPPAQPRR